MVRTGFRLILENEPDIEVLAEASDGIACVELARRLRPDVCLVDIRMPRLNGLEATRLLAGPDVVDPLRILIFTTFDLDDYFYGALRSGACGFLLKNSGSALLIESVRAVAAGAAMISPTVALRLLKQLSADSPAPGSGRTAGHGNQVSRPTGPPHAPDLPGCPPLTERELDVARLVARGRTNQEVTDELDISLSTVKTHLTNIQGKLRVRNRVEIAAWIWESGAIHTGYSP
ncbi:MULTISPECIES: LuxR C-terminal-related transcriptional regulator [unclassified Streptomyces]